MAALSYFVVGLIVLVLGVLAPALVLLGVPLRAAWLLWRGPLSVRAMAAALLVPLVYYASVVLVFGFVSDGAIGRGPTVNPYVWSAIGLAWILVEMMFREAKLHPLSPPKVGVLLSVAALLVPLLCVAVTPARCLYLVARGKPAVRVLSLAVLSLWGWFAVQQVTTWSGLPRSWSVATTRMVWYAWPAVAAAWFFVEVVHYEPQQFGERSGAPL